jgi:hypothetical protein
MKRSLASFLDPRNITAASALAAAAAIGGPVHHARADGACCASDGSCTMSLGPDCLTAGGIYRGDGVACGSVPCGVATLESEPNDGKSTANFVFFQNPGDYIRGNSAALSAVDYYIVTTPVMPLGIYRNRLTITTSGTAGHAGIIHGLNQIAPATMPWDPSFPQVGSEGTIDVAIQTSPSASRMNQWYGFGKQEQLYYAVNGTASTTADYVARWSVDPVTPTDLGTFASGTVTITTVGQGHNTDTQLAVYNSNLDAIDGCSNDGASTLGGAPSNTSTLSWLRRDFPAGTYYLAVSNSLMSSNNGAPSDDLIGNDKLLDFPNVILQADTGSTGQNLSFALTDSFGTRQYPSTKTGTYDINWYRFTISDAPPAGACCLPDGTCQSLTGAGCLAAGGTFRGSGVVCGSVTCPQPGACCAGNGTCTLIPGPTCAASGGVFGGEHSSCAATCGVSSISENFDGVAAGTLPSGWSSTTVNPIPPAGGSPVWTTVTTSANSGTNSVYTSDIDQVSTQTLSMPVVLATGPVTIDFWSRFALDATTSTAFDGWIVQASINGGPYANIGQGAWRDNNRLGDYNAMVNSAQNPITGQRAFSGSSYLTWAHHTASIPANSGDYVSLRFVMAEDNPGGGTLPGVWIDDVQVTSSSTGACCLPDGTCQMLAVAACTGAGGVFSSASSCATATCPKVAYVESEGNDSKATANAITLANPGDYIRGNSTSSTGAGLDYFLVSTPAMSAGIYRHRLTLTTDGSEGHTGTIRGLSQTAAAAGVWPGAVGTPTAGSDAQVQASQTVNSSPPRMNQWYGFGKQEQIYYRVSGTAATTGDYKATWTVDTVIPTNLGNFLPGQITIKTVGQGHSTDTDLWVYDSSFNAMEGFGNDGSSTNGGAPSNASGPSWLARTYGAGTYYLALANTNIANNKGSPCDDNFRSANVLDFPNALVSSSASSELNVAFAVTDSAGTTQFPATRPGGAFEVLWYKFTVAAPCYANCDASTQAPVLNVADFTCFLQKYASGDPYANCDGSTQAPVLNVADFTCFLQKYAAGCSAP